MGFSCPTAGEEHGQAELFEEGADAQLYFHGHAADDEFGIIG
jgi:hypothetical protein